MTLDDWLAHCERLHPKSIDMTLQRVASVRERLGLRFEAPVIIVAGTNGKGSSCAMLEAIARHAGYRTGLYIKPHLVHFEERCRIGGESVPAQALLPHFAAVEAARGAGEATVPTSIGEERATNPFLRAASAQELGRIRALKDAA